MLTFTPRTRVTKQEQPAFRFANPVPYLSDLPIVGVPFGIRFSSARDHIAKGLKRQSNLRWIGLGSVWREGRGHVGPGRFDAVTPV